MAGFGGCRVSRGNDMWVRDRIPNYSLAENKKALAILTTELVPEASLMRESLVWVLDQISQTVFLTEEAMWHIPADVNIGLCKINSGPSPKDLNQWFAGSPALLWARPRLSDRISQQPSDYWETEKVKVLVAQLCLTLCDPMDYSPPGSSVHGILQARILEWVAILFSRGSPPLRDQTQESPAL